MRVKYINIINAPECRSDGLCVSVVDDILEEYQSMLSRRTNTV